MSASFDGKINSWTSVPLPTYEAMKTANNHIKRSLVTDWGGQHLVTVNDDTRLYKKGYYVSEEFLEMFDFPLVAGNATQVLDQPDVIVISESTAKALFGAEDPINKIIRLDNEHDVKVSGVLRDVPKNSTFQFDILIPLKFRKDQQMVRII